MFAAFLDSARSVRKPLVVGYAVLLIGWVLLGGQVRDHLAADAFGIRVVDALEGLGSTSGLALAAVAAYALGALVLRLGLDRLVFLVQVGSGHPDWNAYVGEARAAVRSYEERGSASSTWASHLQSEVEHRCQQRDGSELRLLAAFCAAPVVLAFAVAGGGWWYLLLLAEPLLLGDLWLINGAAWRSIRNGLVGRIEADLDDYFTEDELARDGHEFPMSDLPSAERRRVREARLELLRTARRRQIRDVLEQVRLERVQAEIRSM